MALSAYRSSAAYATESTRAKVFDFDLIFHQRPGQRRNKLPGGNGPEMSSYDRAVGGPQGSLLTTGESSVVGEREHYPPETITVMSPDGRLGAEQHGGAVAQLTSTSASQAHR